jgi:hypothetical protein
VEARMARQQITLRDPSRFKDPANLTWERYVALQARERERYLAERATIPAEVMAYRTVSPRYLERAVDQFELSAEPDRPGALFQVARALGLVAQRKVVE